MTTSDDTAGPIVNGPYQGTILVALTDEDAIPTVHISYRREGQVLCGVDLLNAPVPGGLIPPTGTEMLVCAECDKVHKSLVVLREAQ